MRKILFISTMILLSLQIQAQKSINATFVIIRDSLCMKNGDGDSCVTVIMNDTLVNTTWVRNLILAYDSILHAQYADSAKYADSSGFADTSYFSLNVGAGGSPGDVQYNNAGVLDGAPMTTDGTDIFVTNDLNVAAELNVGFSIDNSITIPSVLDHAFLVNPLSTFPFYYAKSTTTKDVTFKLNEDELYFKTSTSGGDLRLTMDRFGYKQIRFGYYNIGFHTTELILGNISTRLPFIIQRVYTYTDSTISEYTQLDTTGFYIEIDGDIDNPDPQYNFEKDSMWITTKLVQPQVFLQFYTSSPLSEPILSADTYQTIEGMSVSGFSDITYTDSSVTVPAKAYGLYTLNYSVIVQTGTNNTVVHTALFKNDVIIPSTEMSYSLAVKDLDREISATVGEILTPGDVLKLKIEADLTATLTINHIGVYLKRE